jgi:hypothetical protein
MNSLFRPWATRRVGSRGPRGVTSYVTALTAIPEGVGL